MHKDEELKYQIALTMIPNVGCVLAKNLVSYCGSVENIFSASKSKLEKIPGIGIERAASITNHKIFERAEEEVAFVLKHKIKTLFFTDDSYPARLKNCDDSPSLLFLKGECEVNAPRMVAIVGTRNATDYGKEVTEQLVNGFMKYNVVVVSGLAYGIDIIAHKAAIKNNLATIGILAHGLDRIYPAIHRSAAERMIKNGGLLTEFISKTNPDRENFPSRNRIVAGMADAVIVVESAEKGGALITADIANSYNKDVFAIPGNVGEKYSHGCNKLIRENKAMLIESAEEVSQIMNWKDDEKKTDVKQLKFFHELKEEEKILVDLLQTNGQLGIDSLTLRANMPVSKVSTVLLNLEFAGVLKSLPGKMYELI